MKWCLRCEASEGVCVTTKNEKIIVSVVAILLIGIITTLTVLRSQNDDQPNASFTPPEFEVQAKLGRPPNVSEHYDSLSFRIKDGECAVSLEAQPEVKQNDLGICFTSDKNNSVWIRIVLYDGGSDIVGESGILRPGEYVDTVRLNKTVASGDMLEVKILTYEPDTYYSMGAADLTVKVR